MKLFGYTFTKDVEDKKSLQSITPEENDGSTIVDISGLSNTNLDAAYGYSMSFDVDPSIISEQQLITKYREIAMVPEVEMAIDDIINEFADNAVDQIVSVDLDELDYSEPLKTKIREEFEHVVSLLDFNSTSFETVKRWYVDGRIQYQVIVDPNKYTEVGISKLTLLDPRTIKKVKVVKRERDVRTGIDLYGDVEEYYMFSETGFGSTQNSSISPSEQGIKLAADAVVQVTSNILNPSHTVVLSHLHKAIRPLNQLKSLEDAAIIYRLSRAPERRVFYIDVGNLPPAKADQVLKRQMQQYKSKMVYDIASGSVRSDVKQMAMTEDYWLPRRSDGKATEISVLPGGQNLGEMTEVEYFLNKLYRALNVPVSRMDPQAGFNFGRVTEINRDELKFMKFIARLRKQFSQLFAELLKRQLALKNILHPDEFDNIKDKIVFVMKSDNTFEEAKNLELMNGRLDVLAKVHDYRGIYYSDEYIKRNILQQTEDEMDQIAEEIAMEKASGTYEDVTHSQQIERDMADANIEASDAQTQVAQTHADAVLQNAKDGIAVVAQPPQSQQPEPIKPIAQSKFKKEDKKSGRPT